MQQYVTLDLFKSDFLPTIERLVLRAPEIVFGCKAIVITGLKLAKGNRKVRCPNRFPAWPSISVGPLGQVPVVRPFSNFQLISPGSSVERIALHL